MADVELNSIGNGDGTNYLVRDNTKIPLSGSNQISGSLIPATDNAYDLGDSTYGFKSVYAYKLILKNSYITRTVNNDYLGLCGGTDYSSGAYFTLYGKDSTVNAGAFRLRANDGTNSKDLIGKPDGTLSWDGNIIPSKNSVYNLGNDSYMFANIFSYRLYTAFICSYNNTYQTAIYGGTSYLNGAEVTPYGKDHASNGGCVYLVARDGTNTNNLIVKPNGTLSWSGQPIQYGSDARLKQQISQIDDALLTAWEDVDLVQFKYNDAVEEKSDNARLHTGYVVQQIDDACKSHGVDVSKYGLYCHEEYAEETREVEHEDGTKTVEVVRPANEHYSLRYTEALIVECAYMRKKNKDLQEQLNALSERLEKLENR